MRIERPVQTSPSTQRISYAQNMEDILLDRVFGGEAGRFVDVGANHPFEDSNTYFFYLRGWRGVNIEPTREGYESICKYRPEDLNLNVAVSDTEGELPFYEIVGPEGLTGLSTLEADVAEHHKAQGYTVTEHRVPVRTLRSLIAEHQIEPPDLLTIDVEHHEHAVVADIPLDTWRPKVIVVESTVPLSGEATHQVWEPILLQHGYLFATFNGVNRFYLREDLREKLACFETPVNILDQYTRHEKVHLSSRVDALEIELASERFHFNQERGGWAWAQALAQHAQAVYEQDRAEFERQRESWQKALEYFEAAKANWEQERRQYEQEWRAFEQERTTWDRERIGHSQAQLAWQAEREHFEQILTETQRALRPYRLIDRLGVITAGYGWARKLKNKAS